VQPEEESRELAKLVTANADTQSFTRDDVVRKAAAGASEDNPYGVTGPPFGQRSPFIIGFKGALGVAKGI